MKIYYPSRLAFEFFNTPSSLMLFYILLIIILLFLAGSEHPQSVELSDDDLKCLDPESLLSSPIMNFYIL